MVDVQGINEIKDINKIEKRSNFNVILLWCSILFGLEIIILYLIKRSNDAITWGTIFAWAAGGLLFFSVIIAFFYFLNRKQPLEELKNRINGQPNPITIVEAQKIVNNLMYSPIYANYLGQIEKEYVVSVGEGIKSDIYVQVAKGKILNNGKQQTYVIMMNMHFPHQKRGILINPTDYEINQKIKGLATSPEKEKEYEEIVTTSPNLGIQTTVKKPIEKKESEKSEIKNKEENLT